MSQKLQLPPYYKAAILGISLMCVVVVTVIISYFGMRSSTSAAELAIFDHFPAHTELLYIDRDLYQAQMALERAALATDPAQIEAQITVYEENLGQTATRLAIFLELAADIPEREEPVTSYAGYRQHWLQAGERLLAAIESGAGYDALLPLVDQTAASFADMRFALDRISGSVMTPLLQTAGEEMLTRAREARGVLVATLIVALLLGATITASGVGGIRRQYDRMLSEQNQREFDVRRKELEQRIRTGFELIQSEESALTVVREVLEELIPQSHKSELLLADASMAHLRRAVGTHPPGDGCNVVKPEECPAIRRNAQLYFPRNDSFEVCPYLKNRAGEGCSATCVPVNILGRTAGVLHTVGAIGDTPVPEQEQNLRSLVAEAGNVLGMLRAFATKDRQANTDSLTGLANRRSLEATMPAVVSRGVYAVAFADLDKFKQLNDTHGHDTGDRALRLFSDVLRASLRPDDLIARWGGEEFVIVLPGSVDDKAIAVIDRIRERLLEALGMGTVPQFTVSFGMSDSRNAETFDEVVNAADEALLRAKKEGRDRIIYGVVSDEDDRLIEDVLSNNPEDTGPYRRVVA